MLRVVIDTNILLVSVSRKSPFHWVFESIINNKIEICVTTEILLEYEEIISRHMSSEIAESVLDTIQNTKNVIEVKNYFSWNLIPKDSDDNKFADCAVWGNADFLVTNDKDFGILKTLNFPFIKVLDLFAFQKILKEHQLL
ncbi:MAG: putative toxin-antitoxin system toxin component, PIN family [Bacteroidia bacterium]